jgi:hypothetical protein
MYAMAYPGMKIHTQVCNFPPGANFLYVFFGKKFVENSAENFPQKMLGKTGFFRGKSFEKLFFREILRNFPRKEMCEKSAAWTQNLPRETDL